MDSWLNMVLLCGLLLIAPLQMTSAFRYRRSKSGKAETMRTNILHLQQNYNTLGTEWVAKSDFASHLDKLNSKAPCTCQALLLERMLNVYEDIFQHMMDSTKNSEKVKHLNYLMNNVKQLRQNYSKEQTVWRELQDINSIKVKNETTQGGALNDFLMVFNRAITEKHHDKVQ